MQELLGNISYRIPHNSLLSKARESTITKPAVETEHYGLKLDLRQ
jgi:hypothetical protein